MSLTSYQTAPPRVWMGFVLVYREGDVGPFMEGLAATYSPAP